MTREQAEQIARKHVDLRNKTEGHEDALSLSVAVNAIMEAVAVERERLCAAIKAADDNSSEGGYMLDSDDCISVIRGTWQPYDAIAKDDASG